MPTMTCTAAAVQQTVDRTPWGLQPTVRVAKLVFNSGLARVDRPADVEAFIRSHVYKPAHKKLVKSQQLLVGVADGSKTTS
jgi:hypothetical protein